MKGIIALIFILASVNAFTQSETLTKDASESEISYLKKSIQSLQIENSRLRYEISNLQTKFSNTRKTIDSLNNIMRENTSTIVQTARELGIKISAIEINTNEKIQKVDKSLNKNSLYGIIGVLSTVLLSISLYWFLSKRQRTDKTKVIELLQNTKSSIEENLVKEFSKQTNLMIEQIQLLEKQKKNTTIASNPEPDHSLALKVASEINLIERNLALMDNNVKGYKQLKRSVEKLKDNLNANGYEIIDLLGKTYHPGLPVTIINSFPDENLEKDIEIISKVLIPAVRYKDKIIQTAQVEVNIGI